eukprot:GHVS01053772.1.p1 GENE.GHVS01053772.1~~GHVS01053772.1.p1  ORF type:complete len:347 (+),score=47.36 GHVS01053772.1:43-1083(+)
MELNRRKRLKRGGEFVAETTSSCDEEDGRRAMEEEVRRKKMRAAKIIQVGKWAQPTPRCRPAPSLPLPSCHDPLNSSFLHHREDFANKWCQEFNTRIFRNHLPSLSLLWTGSLTSTAGKCVAFKLPCKCSGNDPCGRSVQQWMDRDQKSKKAIAIKRGERNEKNNGINSILEKTIPAGQQEAHKLSPGITSTTHACLSSATISLTELTSSPKHVTASSSSLLLLPLNLRSSIIRFPDGHWGSVRIHLSPKLLNSPFRVCQTLLHEMCHAAQFFFEPSTMRAPVLHCETCQEMSAKTYVDRRPHGPAFWKYAKIASLLYPSLEVSRCHSYQVGDGQAKNRETRKCCL